MALADLFKAARWSQRGELAAAVDDLGDPVDPVEAMGEDGLEADGLDLTRLQTISATNPEDLRRSDVRFILHI